MVLLLVFTYFYDVLSSICFVQYTFCLQSANSTSLFAFHKMKTNSITSLPILQCQKFVSINAFWFSFSLTCTSSTLFLTTTNCRYIFRYLNKPVFFLFVVDFSKFFFYFTSKQVTQLNPLTIRYEWIFSVLFTTIIKLKS